MLRACRGEDPAVGPDADRDDRSIPAVPEQAAGPVQVLCPALQAVSSRPVQAVLHPASWAVSRLA